MGQGAKMAIEFLQSGREGGNGAKMQGRLAVLTGMSWLAYEVVKETVLKAAELATDLEDMLKWEDWDEANIYSEGRERSRVLWQELEQSDKENSTSGTQPQMKRTVVKNVKNEAGGKKRGKAIKKDPNQKTLDGFLIRKVFAVARHADFENDVEARQYLKCEEDLEKECRFRKISTLKLRYMRNEVEGEKDQFTVFRDLDLFDSVSKRQNLL